jgi:hypothetical protein
MRRARGALSKQRFHSYETDFGMETTIIHGAIFYSGLSVRNR